MSYAQSGSFDKLRLQTIADVRAKIQPALLQYCKDACMVIDIAPIIDENLGESEDLGFEGVSAKSKVNSSQLQRLIFKFKSMTG